ncbi:cation diffusion facilitator family transporter [Scopulibacillus darangshiensis]|uniref:Cation diffusion facilitator family transporter n=1 Tax=Scopulibacillus darangshiensis TaxID=442528 RepID=A0A4R2P773_9BACL|nr:cation diffusion facilitator family transporter [Scopulibacillus darangshiensis]TCP30024.1 cation diffusion facilitator family transporter [Scopulibacillus darangshiensis]
MEDQYYHLKLGERGAIISIVAYLLLSALKLIIGFSADSEALRADGLNNTTDIIASIAVLIGLRLSQKPPDKDHPYGHRKAESVSSMVASFIMAAVGLQVLYQAVLSLFDQKGHVPDLPAALTALVSAIAMYGVYRYNLQLSKKAKSHALKAAAKDNLSDAWVSIGTAVGIIGSQFNLPWLDPLTALIVGLLICKTAWDIFSESSHYLTDGFDEGKLEDYKDTVAAIPGITAVDNIKARSYGTQIIADVIIHVEPSMDVQKSHDLTEQIEKVLAEEHQIREVHVHVEPDKA